MTSGSATGAALRFLGLRAYFRSELGVRLARKGFGPDDVEAALDRCAELGYLDDRATADRFVQLRAEERGWGPRRLAAELRQRGVGEGLAEEASRLSPQQLAGALRAALRLAERRRSEGWWRVGRERARMVSSLVSRGFDADDADEAISELAAERESPHHAPDEQPGDPLDLP